MGKRCCITTVDNPFDPFDEFTKWYLYDMRKGYNSCGFLANLARTSEEFTDEENERQIERAIDEIIRLDFQNIYRKVTRTVP